MRVALATTVHDLGGHLVPGVERTGSLIRALFPVVVLNATSVTHPRLLDAATRQWRATVQTHPPGNVVGRSRRDALRAALDRECDRVLADLMFAVRVLSPRVAEAEGLDYRTNPDFDKPSDGRDLDPLAWIDRAEIGVQHPQVMRRFVAATESV